MNVARLFARIKKLEFLSVKIVDELLSGRYRSVFRGPGLEFAEVREYVEGDDPRLIDWNVSARSGQTYLKTFREEREMTLFLLVDLSASMHSGRSESSLRESVDMLFSVFALAAANNNDKVGVCFFTDRIEFWVNPAKGKTHAMRLIQDLLNVKPKGRGSNLTLAIRTAGEALSRRGICVMISDFKTDGYQRDLSALARRHDVIAIRLIPPDDLDFPSHGTFHVQDPETGTTMTAHGFSPRFRRDYRDFWVVERKLWVHDLRKRGVSTLEISAEDDPVARLFQFFERRHHGRVRR